MTKIARYLFGNEDAKNITTRTIAGEHWYMALDVCSLLVIENHSQAVHRDRVVDRNTLNENEWCKVTIYTGTSRRKVLMISNSGMLKLIFQGKSPRALEVQERARKTPINLKPASWSDEILKIR